MFQKFVDRLAPALHLTHANGVRLDTVFLVELEQREFEPGSDLPEVGVLRQPLQCFLGAIVGGDEHGYQRYFAAMIQSIDIVFATASPFCRPKVTVSSSSSLTLVRGNEPSTVPLTA